MKDTRNPFDKPILPDEKIGWAKTEPARYQTRADGSKFEVPKSNIPPAVIREVKNTVLTYHCCYPKCRGNTKLICKLCDRHLSMLTPQLRGKLAGFGAIREHLGSEKLMQAVEDAFEVIRGYEE